jgi:hypothetical protein
MGMSTCAPSLVRGVVATSAPLAVVTRQVKVNGPLPARA